MERLALEAAASRYRSDEKSEVLMVAQLRRRFWLEAGFGLGCGILAVLTLVWRDWIEALTGFDPDRGSGAVEVTVVLVLAGFALLAGCSTYRIRMQARAGAGP
jgi:hypothetical protein